MHHVLSLAINWVNRSSLSAKYSLYLAAVALIPLPPPFPPLLYLGTQSTGATAICYHSMGIAFRHPQVGYD